MIITIIYLGYFLFYCLFKTMNYSSIPFFIIKNLIFLQGIKNEKIKYYYLANIINWIYWL